jgi:hypothetical protein
LFRKIRGTIVLRAKGTRGLNDFVGESASARVAPRENERNESGETQFNKKRGAKLVELFFLDNLKRLRNKSEIY